MSLLCCPGCESVHFNVNWDEPGEFWQICCEGCGKVFNLWPKGVLAEKLGPELAKGGNA